MRAAQGDALDGGTVSRAVAGQDAVLYVLGAGTVRQTTRRAVSMITDDLDLGERAAIALAETVHASDGTGRTSIQVGGFVIQRTTAGAPAAESSLATGSGIRTWP